MPPPMALCGHRVDWICDGCARCVDCCTGHATVLNLVHQHTKAAAEARHRAIVKLRESDSNGSAGPPTPGR